MIASRSSESSGRMALGGAMGRYKMDDIIRALCVPAITREVRHASIRAGSTQIETRRPATARVLFKTRTEAARPRGFYLNRNGTTAIRAGFI